MNSFLKQGNAMVEGVLVMVLITFLIGGSVFLLRVALFRQRALAGARLGSFLLSIDGVSPETAEEEVKTYLAGASPGATVEWKWEMGRFQGTPASVFYRLVGTRIFCELPNPFSRSEVSSFKISERVVTEEGSL